MEREWLNTIPCVKTQSYATKLRDRAESYIRQNIPVMYIESASCDTHDYLHLVYDRKTHIYELIYKLRTYSMKYSSIEISQLTEADMELLKTKLINASALYLAIEEVWKNGFHQETVDLFGEPDYDLILK